MSYKVGAYEALQWAYRVAVKNGDSDTRGEIHEKLCCIATSGDVSFKEHKVK